MRSISLFIGLLLPYFFDHNFELLFIRFELNLQLLYLSILVIDSPLQSAHSQEELLHLKTQLLDACPHLLVLPRDWV